MASLLQFLMHLEHRDLHNHENRPIMHLASRIMLPGDGCTCRPLPARKLVRPPQSATGGREPEGRDRRRRRRRRALTDRPEDEKAIRAVGDAFTRAFDAGDAKAVAALYTEDAELIDENGDGSRADRRSRSFYASIFQEGPGATIEISIDSLRFLGPDVAKEEGQTRRQVGGESPRPSAATPFSTSSRRAMAVFQRPRRARRGRRAPRASQGAGMAGRRMARPELGLDRPRDLPLVGRTRTSCSAISRSTSRASPS